MQFKKYKSNPMLWIPDLIIGAAAYHKNGWHLRSDAAKCKVDLADHIANRLGVSKDWPTIGFPWEDHKKFTIWNFGLQDARKGGPRS
jgi:hypothetical protein